MYNYYELNIYLIVLLNVRFLKIYIWCYFLKLLIVKFLIIYSYINNNFIKKIYNNY
jgi:hypothetical protein